MEHKKISEIMKILSCIEYGLILLLLFSLIARIFSGIAMMFLLYALGVLSGYLGMTIPLQDVLIKTRNFFLRGNNL